MIAREAVHNRMAELGYAVFDGEYDMNVVGLRRVPGTVNAFDDVMTLSFRERGAWRFFAWPCTTEPGGKYLGKPMTVHGTAIMQPGQYRGVYRLGVHGATKPWAHDALVQSGPLKVWRDANRDQVLDHVNDAVSTAGGINIHRHLGDFSAGCQVFERRDHFEEFIRLVRQQLAAGLGDRFTYTLLDWPADDFGAVEARKP